MYRAPSPALPLSCLCQDSNAVVASMRNSSTHLENASISTRMIILQSQGAYVVQVVTLEWIVRGTGEGVRVYVELHLAGSSAGSMSTVKWMYWQHGHYRMNVMNFRYWGVVTTLELCGLLLSYHTPCLKAVASVAGGSSLISWLCLVGMYSHSRDSASDTPCWTSFPETWQRWKKVFPQYLRTSTSSVQTTHSYSIKYVLALQVLVKCAFST